MDNPNDTLARAWSIRPDEGRNQVFEDLLETLSAQGSVQAASYASVLNEYASYLRVNGLYDYGARMFLRALDKIAEVDGKKTAYAICLSNYAELCRLTGDFETSGNALATAERLYESKESIEFAANLNYQSNLYQSQHDPRRAALVLEKSLAIVEKLKPCSIDLATAYQNLGGIRLQSNELDEALVKLEKALSIYEALDAKNNAHFVSLCNTLAMVYIKRDEPDKAASAFDTCLETMKSCNMNPDDSASVARNAAAFFEQQGNDRRAQEARDLA